MVYTGDRILAEAANNREETRDPVGHAELLAMGEAGRVLKDWRLIDCTLAVTLEPCPMCAGAIIQARIQKVVYGCPDPKAGALGSVVNLAEPGMFNHDIEVVGGILKEPCQFILKEFFVKRRTKDGA